MIDTAEILQSTTVAATAGQINNFFTGFSVVGGAGANTISLRGLGANRTLVLINGRRAGPAGVGGQIGPADLNTIPTGQMARIEILTDGASSIYGSDAVAGVINIITKTNQAGGDFQVHANLPFEAGGEQFNLQASHGWTSDKGYLSLGTQYTEIKALEFGDRDAFRCPQTREFYDPQLTSRADLIDPTTNDYKCIAGPDNQIMAARLTPQGLFSYTYQRSPTAVGGGGIVGCDEPGWLFVGDGGGTACSIGNLPLAARRQHIAQQNYYPKRFESRTAISPIRRTSLSAFAGYDLTSTLEVFGEFQFSRRQSSQTNWQQLFPNVKFDHPNYPLPKRHPLGNFTDYATVVTYVPALNAQKVDYTRAIAGIRGQLDFGRGFEWELAAQYSRSDADYTSNAIASDRLYATSGYHQGRDLPGEPLVLPGFASGDNLTEFAQTGCVTAWLRTASACPKGGVNWFSEALLSDGRFTAEEQAFLTVQNKGTTVYTHAYLEGLISGELFELPAGPASGAIGFQLRYEDLDDVPGIHSRDSNTWSQSSAGRTKGDDRIKEVFAELELPLLTNLRLANSLILNLSGRYSDYDSYGDSSTYKAGFNWSVTPQYRLRASYGTAFRAPALYELYLGDQSTFIAQTAIDPCVNWPSRLEQMVRDMCQAQGIPETYSALNIAGARVLSGGGAGKVKAETAKTLSLGFVWTPSFSKLNLALDYYKVAIKDQIARFGAASIVTGCYGFGGYQDTGLCDLFSRAPATAASPYQITQVRDSFINIASQTSEGLDLNLRYTEAFALGDLTLGARASYILDWTSQLASQQAPLNQLGRIGQPDWVANLSAQFAHKDWVFYWHADITPEHSNNSAPRSGTNLFGETVYYDTTADSTLYHTLSLAKTMDSWIVIAGINNVFDENAPWTSAVGGSRGAGNVPISSQYDYLGRRIFFTLKRRW